jgi:hypothetical protein
MFGSTQKPKQKRIAGGTSKAKAPGIHSIGALLKGREFSGSFAVAGTAYEFTYAPARAAIVGHRLQLTGSLSVTPSDRGAASRSTSIRGVKATLAGIQGGIGSAPPRRKLPSEVYPPREGLPSVDSTGSLSFAGVLYFHFEPLNARALGVNADLSRVQLNARLWPVDNTERKIQAAFSDAADALLGKQANPSLAAEAASELNGMFSA